MDHNELQSETGPVYSDTVPLKWKVLKDTPDAAHLVQMNESTEEILRIFYVLDEYHAEPEDEHNPLAQELKRIDFKVNLVLDLVGQILSNSLSIPAPVDMQLSAQGIAWLNTKAPDVGDLIHMEIYLKPKFPRPINMYARVKSTDPVQTNLRIEAHFEYMSEQVSNWLEKIVFRQHRRMIAQTRHKAGV